MMPTSYLLACVLRDAGYPFARTLTWAGFTWSPFVRSAIRRIGPRMFGLWAAKRGIPARFVLESLRRTSPIRSFS